jgi:sterol desaturase/sphingolipid hydroxylase (fatty acid hydroxylase superfamily)
VSEGQLQAVRGAAFVAAMLVAVILQRAAPHARLRGSWRVNGAIWMLATLVVGAACGACGFTAARWAERAGFGLLHQLPAPVWAAVPLTLLLLDLVSYGWHRANHGVAPLWRLHRVHHSDPTFTVSTGLRFHPGELLLSLPVRVAAILLVGASVEAVLIFEVVFTFANLIEHGDIDLPRRAERLLTPVLVTPALHRRHHTRSGRPRNSNFGTIFSTWDRLFGTYFHSDSTTRVDTGLPDLDTVSLGRALLMPFLRLGGV